MQLQFDEVERSLTLRPVRIMQITYGVLTFNVMSLLVVFLFLLAMSPDHGVRELPAGSPVDTLSLVLWGIFVLGMVESLIFFRVRTSPKQDALHADETARDGVPAAAGPAVRFIALMQQGIIGRAVLITFPALVSTVACIYWALREGAFLTHPERLAHLLPAFVQIAFLAITWPTRDRVLSLARNRLAN